MNNKKHAVNVTHEAPVRHIGHTRISDIPQSERPRERFFALGAQALSTSELLALLIGSGTKGQNVLDLATRLLSWADEEGASDEGALRKILRASVEDICRIPGMGASKAAKVKAALELGRRLSQEGGPRTVIHSPRDVGDFLMEEMRHLEQEHFKVVHLGVKNQVLGVDLVSVGTVGSSLVHPREVFKNSIKRNATGVILVHNHPSGDPTPSREDVSVTRRVADAGRILGIEVLDHIVIGDRRFVSLRESGSDWNH